MEGSNYLDTEETLKDQTNTTINAEISNSAMNQNGTSTLTIPYLPDDTEVTYVEDSNIAIINRISIRKICPWLTDHGRLFQTSTI
ncbi:hypothetical protein ID741_000650 [Enterococcus sp. AZ103]